MARHTVIIGNGVAGITAAMTLRERDARARITVVSGETDYYFSRTALMYAFMGKMDRPDLEPFERKVYPARGIELLRDWVTDLDAERRTLRREKAGALGYDRLLLATGSVPRRLGAVPGLESVRAGLVNFVSMQDLDACEALAPTTREAVVVGGGLIGIELVECLLHHGIKTRFLVREPWYWPVALCREEGELVTAHMRHMGADVMHEQELGAVEADASGRVSAVVTKTGSRLPAQMLGVCIGVEPARGFLEKATTPPRLGRGIVVDEYLRTSLQDVWSAGDCAEIHFGPADPRVWPYRRDATPPSAAKPLIEQIWYSSKRQGALAAHNMSSARPEPYRPPLFFNSAKFFEVEYTTVGDLLALPAGTRGLFRKHKSRLITQRILHHEGRVVGFNMLGSRWDHAVLSRWIDEQRELDWVLANLRAAQFDVEFGRAKVEQFAERDLEVVARTGAMQ